MENRQLAKRLFAQRGITLLEIMIVLAIIGLVMGVLIGPRVFRMFAEAKEDIARIHMSDLANNAYGMWQRDFPDAQCPEKLEDLVKYSNKKEVKDPWGTPYLMKCGEGLPEGTSFGLVSAGPDRKENTPDDIRSWESKSQQQKK
jgi:general secretion pathway protein G